MIAAWWSLVAFVAGGCAGLLLIGLMRTAAEQDLSAPEPIELNDRPRSIRNG
jgi:hypothetical protein